MALTKEQERKHALRECQAVEQAILDGYPAIIDKYNTKQKTAVRIAAERLGEERRNFTKRVGTPTKTGIWAQKYGVSPNWNISDPNAPDTSSKEIAGENKYPVSDFEALPFCEFTRDHGWVRRLAGDYKEDVTVEKRDGAVESFERTHYDPGVIYPADWDGPLATDINVKKSPRYSKINAPKVVFAMGAQDKTPVMGPALNSMMAYAQYTGAEIVVGQSTYARDWYNAIFGGTGRTSRQEKDKTRVRDWSSALEDYLTSKPVRISDNFDFRAEVNILPTARRPLTGLGTYGQSRSVMFAHPRQDLESVPRHPSDDPVVAMTSGFITSPNYVDRKTGNVARFHHIVGFAIFEIGADGFCLPPRHVHIDMLTGEFQDLDVCVDGHGNITTGNSVEGIDYGDAHFFHIDPKVAHATWYAPNSIQNVLKPKEAFLHDTLDFYGKNHHNRFDPWHAFETKVRGLTVVGEIDQACKGILSALRSGTKHFVVASNHDESFTRYLKEVDWRHDPTNAEINLETNLWAIRQLKQNPDAVPAVYEYYCRALYPDALKDVTFLKRCSKHLVAGVEMSGHGDKGPNGAKGSTSGHLRGARKKANADCHSPEKREGVARSGTMMKMDPMPKYARGGDSSWAHAHVVVYKGGKMTIVFVKGARWLADDYEAESAFDKALKAAAKAVANSNKKALKKAA